MWLQTRRAINELKESWILLDFQSNINWITWGNMNVKIEEDSFNSVNEDYIHLFERWIKEMLLNTLEEVINWVAADDLWKEAISKWIEKIIIAYEESCYPQHLEVCGWVLTIKYDVLVYVGSERNIDDNKSTIEKYIYSVL